MDYTGVYNCKLYFPNILCLIPFIIVAFGLYILINLRNPFLTKPKMALLFGSMFVLVGICVSALIISTIIQNYKNVIIPYSKGKYLITEGETKNLKAAPFMGAGPDEFDVSGVHFSLGGSMAAGYQKQAAYGGTFNKNGLKVRIRYLSINNANYITKIEIQS